MALYSNAVTPSLTKTASTPAAVAASDTIAAADIGINGCLLIVNNGGGSSINVTISDPGATPMGNAGSALAQAVANGTFGVFRIPSSAVNSSTGVATVTYSATTSVTAELYRL